MKKALLSALFVPACLLLAVPAMADNDRNAAPAAAAAATEPAAAPCTGDNCPKSQGGYDWAAEHQITDAKDCTEGDKDFKDGCILYVQEKALDAGEKEFEGNSSDE